MWLLKYVFTTQLIRSWLNDGRSRGAIGFAHKPYRSNHNFIIIATRVMGIVRTINVILTRNNSCKSACWTATICWAVLSALCWKAFCTTVHRNTVIFSLPRSVQNMSRATIYEKHNVFSKTKLLWYACIIRCGCSQHDKRYADTILCTICIRTSG